MFHDDGYALLIGVDDYRTFDRSVGRPEGSSDLKGSVLDAHVFWRLCLELGMRPENIRVVASPRPDLGLFPGATEGNLGEATEAGVRGAVSWLSDKLAGGRSGLLTYSGHGAHTQKHGLLLCPSDTARAGFDHAIPFRELRAALGEGAKNLTVVLDCCHDGRTPSERRERLTSTLGGDALSPGERADEMLIGARVLAACQPGQTTQQASFGGAPHGAFSWAIGAIVEQWKTVDQRGNVRLDLSYGTLITKARQLLALLDFDGTPTLYGPPGAEQLAVMQVGSRSMLTSARPDGARPQVQIDPGQKGYRYYTFRDSTNTVVATVLVPNTSGPPGSPTYQAGTEYWFGVSTSTPLRSLNVTWGEYDWGERGAILPTGTPSFTMTRTPTWGTPDSGEPPTGSYVFACFSPSDVTLAWELTYSSGVWGGRLKWFNTTGQNNVFAGPMPSGGVNLTSNPSYPRGLTWSKAVVAPGS